MINGVVIKYGLFIQPVVDFLIVALVVFLMVKALNNLKKKREVVVEISSTDKLLIEISDSMRK